MGVKNTQSWDLVIKHEDIMRISWGFLDGKKSL
jgi:hypothetical protein